MITKKHYLPNVFNWFSLAATDTATAASPVTLTVVLTISKIRSTPKIKATPALGTPTDSSMIINIIIPAAGTAAVPIDANTVVSMIVI